MTATAHFHGEQITATLTAATDRSDYGVPRSPRWDEIDLSSAKIEELTILGVTVDPHGIPADLREAILELKYDVEWKNDEE